MIAQAFFILAHRIDRQSYLSWEYFDKPTRLQKYLQKALHAMLAKRAGGILDKNSYISPAAKIFTSSLRIGSKSYICGGSIIRGEFSLGAASGVGAYCHIDGKVTIGDDTMIANNVSVFGINHGTDIASPMGQQASTMKGVVIGSDCWVGANVSIVDGANIGSHSIVAAGAVVTRSFPEWSVIGGVPARIIKSRK
ncbi:acyltransferase [Acidomonas methanolica]|uniref:Acetyltransferase n=1 Tax=Acidomonas methanolica NBRC 104435 TaxID=1231351 RepID=A0A023D2Q8_ACIMT|nr:acyltransferase [Acidomonas methanolica]MCQ9154249.1 acyltransferase [Acidomonas methanolica]TCS30608.1 transferase family hexapeptide repeat protein [Acidomonas methanolica]GAJ28349.1 acetyltransferase [Acidomonas methanolica NBRC 104435]GBQ52434.1 acetyltransferase [Acidomonas methanolica]GEK98833.1 hypothetical protein AME01nite_13320 [Acidomonas methanolica NBRC 104435]